MKIFKACDKRKYMPLLLLADEQADMIERYIDRATLYILDDGGIKGEIAVCDEGGGILEIKNLAVYPQYQRRGYGRALIEFICEKYRGHFDVLQVGTGDSPLTLPFYENCGFVKSHVIKNFFTDNYDHEIIEGGVKLIDMVCLQRAINC